MLQDKDLRVQDKLPSKEERAEMKKQQENDQADSKIIQAKCIKFFNEEIVNQPIPFYLAEEVVRASMNVLFSIHKSKSKVNAEYQKAKAKMEDALLNEMEYVNKT